MPVDIKDTEFEEKVVEESHNQPVVLDFWAPWCGPCKALAPILDSLEASNENKIKVVKVNIDDYPDMAKEHGVLSIPTMSLYVDGNETKRHVGVSSLSHLERSFLGKGDSFFKHDAEDH